MIVKFAKEKARESLDRLLSVFKSGKFPPAIARTVIRRASGANDRPADKWGLGNQILMLAAGTTDARGFKQWEKVGRKVVKGAKAFHILGPVTKTRVERVRDPETGTEAEENRQFVVGFKLIPVFRVEDTDGEPVKITSYDPPELPPLWDTAKAFGVKGIHYVPAGDGISRGKYVWGTGGKKIVLATHDVKTWFHELGHAVHHSFRQLKGGQHPEQEIVAEVFAATMCELHEVKGCEQHAWEYVRAYVAGQDPDAALKAIFSVLADVQKCLDLVLACETPVERGCVT